MTEIAAEGSLAIRPMRDDPADYRAIARWRAEPHVHEWWDPDEPAPSYEEVVAKYGPRARAEDDATACIIEWDGRAIGYVQFYRWLPFTQDEPAIDVRPDGDTFGLDIHIGEPDLIDRGIGSSAVDLLCRYLEHTEHASWIALTTEVANTRAQRAYEKAGFVKVRRVLDTDTRDGERVACWLMERRHG
jgi:aminoglycoside 6'-N-acetyltransferase